MKYKEPIFLEYLDLPNQLCQACPNYIPAQSVAFNGRYWHPECAPPDVIAQLAKRYIYKLNRYLRNKSQEVEVQPIAPPELLDEPQAAPKKQPMPPKTFFSGLWESISSFFNPKSKSPIDLRIDAVRSKYKGMFFTTAEISKFLGISRSSAARVKDKLIDRKLAKEHLRNKDGSKVYVLK